MPDVPTLAWIAGGAAAFVAGCLLGRGFTIYKVAHGYLQIWLDERGRVRYRQRRSPAGVIRVAEPRAARDRQQPAEQDPDDGQAPDPSQDHSRRASDDRVRWYKARPRRSPHRKIR